MKRKHYVVGLIFSQHEGRIALLRKTHPPWQKGKLNGVGGHIEQDEEPLEAMIREAKEEVGLEKMPWEHIAILKGPAWTLHVYKTNLPAPFEPEELMGQEDERVEVHVTSQLSFLELIPNLRYLIPFAINRLEGDIMKVACT